MTTINYYSENSNIVSTTIMWKSEAETLFAL